ncbi:hypothetical protein ACFWP7_16135 [Streptomyces sp. NPDC058470]|uniref:hypothetical protein n=1 Tax=Streptomyces sp. NPDC058470 TaxID=3346515 RepID=UPI003648B522
MDLSTRLRAVQLHKPQLVISHRSAAALWRIEVLNLPQGAARGAVPRTTAQGTTAQGATSQETAQETALEFCDPTLSVRREGNGVRVYRLPLAQGDVVERGGLRITGVSRTLADLLRAGPRDDALVAVESALTWRRVGGIRRAPLTTRDAIAAALEAPLLGAARGRHRLKHADPFAGSPAETIARLRMHDAGLRPESQAELLTPGGRRCRLDFLFRAEGLAVEIEGYAYHGTRASHHRDITRYNQVLQCPEVRLLLRYTAADVFGRPAQIIEEIHTALTKLGTLPEIRTFRGSRSTET